jgi:hypothetical protein
MPRPSGVPHLRLVRDPGPVASYVRPFGQDLRRTAQLIAEGLPVGSGIVVDACERERARDLIHGATGEGIEVVLDPRSAELALPGGRAPSILTLPWAEQDMEIGAFAIGSHAKDRVVLAGSRTCSATRAGISW